MKTFEEKMALGISEGGKASEVGIYAPVDDVGKIIKKEAKPFEKGEKFLILMRQGSGTAG